MRPNTVHIALGSNLGDRLAYLQSAVDAFHGLPETIVTCVSGVYESPAHTLPGAPDQPDYLNAVLEIETALDQEELLDAALEMECGSGRIRSRDTQWEPRTLDVDILVWGNATRSTKRLVLPHPRLGQRLFVLKPFAEIAPETKIPAPFDRTVRYLLSTCPDTANVVRTKHVLMLPAEG